MEGQVAEASGGGHGTDKGFECWKENLRKDIKTKRIKTANIIDTGSSKVQNKFTNEEIETRHHPHGVHHSARRTPLTPGSSLAGYEDVGQATPRPFSISAGAVPWKHRTVGLLYVAVFPPPSISLASGLRRGQEKGCPNQGTRTAFGKSLLPSH